MNTYRIHYKAVDGGVEQVSAEEVMELGNSYVFVADDKTVAMIPQSVVQSVHVDKNGET